MNLRVRSYNVEFGDATLISIPEKDVDGTERYRHILVDVGNRGTPDDNRLFRPVMEDVLGELNNEPLDLYVMTHEHLDHVQGIPYADKYHYGNEDDTKLLDDLNAKFSWFPISSKKGYENTVSASTKAKINHMKQSLKAIDTFMSTLQAMGEPVDQHLQTLLSINIGWTSHCVDHLLKCKNPLFVYQDPTLSGHHPFTEAKIEVWAPEKDIGVYLADYSMHQMNLGTPTKPLIPPQGVDAGVFYDLVATREMFYENLLAANSSTNNTSIVFCIEWRGNRLLFTGDAEEASWKEMQRQGVLKDVHFLKISHHGSHNGTPEPEILDEVLPPGSPVGRYAVLSTALGPYDSIPDADTLALIEERCERLYKLHLEVDPGKYKDIEFTPKT